MRCKSAWHELVSSEHNLGWCSIAMKVCKIWQCQADPSATWSERRYTPLQLAQQQGPLFIEWIWWKITRIYGCWIDTGFRFQGFVFHILFIIDISLVFTIYCCLWETWDMFFMSLWFIGSRAPIGHPLSHGEWQWLATGDSPSYTDLPWSRIRVLSYTYQLMIQDINSILTNSIPYL